MSKEEISAEVDRILAIGSNDPEASHSHEDRLHLRVIREFCPDWVVEEINRLDEGDFARWCA